MSELVLTRQRIMQEGRERYRISRAYEPDGRVDVSIGAFVYNPEAPDSPILSTWVNKLFDSADEANVWIEEVTK